ncbi:hypothetical protein C8R45DRAFT_1096194 [Mycena sanguinolenta]|nr:hypothetical protein C8R45DRAFT_1096194 [Mycena sanguinolenta]
MDESRVALVLLLPCSCSCPSLSTTLRLPLAPCLNRSLTPIATSISVPLRSSSCSSRRTRAGAGRACQHRSCSSRHARTEATWQGLTEAQDALVVSTRRGDELAKEDAWGRAFTLTTSSSVFGEASTPPFRPHRALRGAATSHRHFRADYKARRTCERLYIPSVAALRFLAAAASSLRIDPLTAPRLQLRQEAAAFLHTDGVVHPRTVSRLARSLIFPLRDPFTVTLNSTTIGNRRHLDFSSRIPRHLPCALSSLDDADDATKRGRTDSGPPSPRKRHGATFASAARSLDDAALPGTGYEGETAVVLRLRLCAFLHIDAHACTYALPTAQSCSAQARSSRRRYAVHLATLSSPAYVENPAMLCTMPDPANLLLLRFLPTAHTAAIQPQTQHTYLPSPFLCDFSSTRLLFFATPSSPRRGRTPLLPQLFDLSISRVVHDGVALAFSRPVSGSRTADSSTITSRHKYLPPRDWTATPRARDGAGAWTCL